MLTDVSEELIASITRFITLMMEAVSASETLDNIHQTTQWYIPEDNHLHKTYQ
jgi:hypothetical protein